MSIYEKMINFSLAGMFLGALLFIFFSIIVVRKLRKKEKTKDVLGLEFISGDNAFNVAQALSWPRSIYSFLEKKARDNGRSHIVANSDALYANTNIFDRIFARVVYWLLALSVLSLVIFSLLEDFLD